MTCRISHTSFDCRDPYGLARWWAEVLGWADGYADDPDDFNAPEHDECMIHDPGSGRQLLFIRVPEAKAAKNRVHLDLRPVSGTCDAEVARLLGLGATEVADHRGIHGEGTGWVVLADPEGNELCVLQP